MKPFPNAPRVASLIALWLYAATGCVLPDVQSTGARAQAPESAPPPSAETRDPAEGGTHGAGATALLPQQTEPLAHAQGGAGGAQRPATEGNPEAGSSAATPGMGGGGGLGGTLAIASAAGTQGGCTRMCFPLGTSCNADSQCTSGSCMEKCRQPSSFGTSCDSKADCVAPLECSRIMLCQYALGASCRADSDCATGACIQTTCEPTHEIGETCDSEADCSQQAQCVSGSCRAALDSKCMRDADCASGSCSPYAKKCQVPGSDVNLANGQTCVEDQQCSSGSCGWEHKCSGRVGSTINCNSDPDCESGLYCYLADSSDDIGYCRSKTN